MIFVPWQLGQWRACMIMTSLDRKGVALTLIYPERIADPTPLKHPPQPHPRRVGHEAGRDPAAPAVAPAGPAHTGLRAHPRARHPTRRSGPRERPWSQTDAGV